MRGMPGAIRGLCELISSPASIPAALFRAECSAGTGRLISSVRSAAGRQSCLVGHQSVAGGAPLSAPPRHLQVADKRLGINCRLACFITWTLGWNVITGEYKFSATERQEEGCKNK